MNWKNIPHTTTNYMHTAFKDQAELSRFINLLQLAGYGNHNPKGMEYDTCCATELPQGNYHIVKTIGKTRILEVYLMDNNLTPYTDVIKTAVEIADSIKKGGVSHV